MTLCSHRTPEPELPPPAAWIATSLRWTSFCQTAPGQPHQHSLQAPTHSSCTDDLVFQEVRTGPHQFQMKAQSNKWWWKCHRLASLPNTLYHLRNPISKHTLEWSSPSSAHCFPLHQYRQSGSFQCNYFNQKREQSGNETPEGCHRAPPFISHTLCSSVLVSRQVIFMPMQSTGISTRRYRRHGR